MIDRRALLRALPALTPPGLALLGCAAPTAPTDPPAPTPEAGFRPASGLSAPGRPAEIRTFTFQNWAGPPIPVWSYRPTNASPDAPILVVHHGVGRDADRYLNEWIPIAQDWGVLVACPEFSQASFPRAAGYNLGGVVDEAGAPRLRANWAFSAIEPLFQELRRREGMRTARFQVYGHSAGGQFVHRLMLFAPPTSATAAVAANPGWYTRANLEEAWPFGLKGAPADDAMVRAWLARDLTILLGTADNDPAHPSLNRDPPAMAQGPHRLARGEAFFTEAQALAASLGAPFAWRKAYAPGVGHENGKMADFAASIFFAASTQRTP